MVLGPIVGSDSMTYSPPVMLKLIVVFYAIMYTSGQIMIYLSMWVSMGGYMSF